MNVKIAIGIQSTFTPPDRLNEADWRLYLSVRSMRKLKLIRRLNNQLNQVLKQKMIIPNGQQ